MITMQPHPQPLPLKGGETRCSLPFVPPFKGKGYG